MTPVDMDRHGLRARLRTALAPRRPELGLFSLIISSVALTIAVAIPLALTAAGKPMSPWAIAWYPATLFASLSVGLLVAQAWTWLVPARLYASRRLSTALLSSYMPYLGGVVAAVWFGMWLRLLLPISAPAVGRGTTMGIIAGVSGLWAVVALLANHLAAMHERERRDTATLTSLLADLAVSRQRIVNAHEALRKEVAGALHGPVQNRLLLASVKLKQALCLPPDAAIGHIVDAVAAVEEVVNMDLRSLIAQLHPSVIRLGLAAGLRSLAESSLHNIGARLQVDDAVAELDRFPASAIPEPVRLALYRVAQDAFNNIVKHSGATQVVVELTMPRPDALLLTVCDNGRGFDTASARRGLGIPTMRDYCGAHGGSLSMESAPGQGTRVRASIPIHLEDGGQGEPAGDALSQRKELVLAGGS